MGGYQLTSGYPKDKPTWACCQIVEEQLNRHAFKKQIKKLNKSGETVTDKMTSLAQSQQMQVTNVLENLGSSEHDRRFEWSLVQLDRRIESASLEPSSSSKKKPSSLKKKQMYETVTITVYVKRAPLPDSNCVMLWQAIINKHNPDMQRPPSPPQQHQYQPPPPPPPPQNHNAMAEGYSISASISPPQQVVQPLVIDRIIEPRAMVSYGHVQPQISEAPRFTKSSYVRARHRYDSDTDTSASDSDRYDSGLRLQQEKHQFRQPDIETDFRRPEIEDDMRPREIRKGSRIWQEEKDAINRRLESNLIASSSCCQLRLPYEDHRVDRSSFLKPRPSFDRRQQEAEDYTYTRRYFDEPGPSFVRRQQEAEDYTYTRRYFDEPGPSFERGQSSPDSVPPLRQFFVDRGLSEARRQYLDRGYSESTREYRRPAPRN